MTNCWFSNLCLWTSIECEYCLAIMLTCLNVFFIFVIESFCFISRLSLMVCAWVAFMSDVKIMSGATFHPLILMLLMSG